MKNEILGLNFDSLTMAEALDAADALIAAGEGGRIVTANPEILLAARQDAVYRAAVNGADLVLADAPTNSVPYTAENGGELVTVHLGGEDFVFEYKDGAYIFDFAGTMVLRFEKEAE